MSNKKQTAVEWLVDQLLNKKGMVVISTSTFYFDKNVIEQAKAMEKEQTITAMINTDTSKQNITEIVAKGMKYWKETYEQ